MATSNTNTTTASASTTSADFLLQSVSQCCNERLKRVRGIDENGAHALELAVCEESVVHWLTWWGWTYDPRQAIAYLPFVPFPRQKEFLEWLENREAAGEDGLVEKSRDQGVSWLCCAFAVHRWRFRPGSSIGFGSRKQEYVDELGNPDSLLEKCRILIERLPTWMRPKGYRSSEHGMFCKIINPETGATITGEAGDNIGRGGRKLLYFLDEAAFIERPHLIDRSLSQTTRCRFDVSTPNGVGNSFYQKRHGGIVPVFTFRWDDDPRKDQAWLDEQKRKFDPVTVAQEILIDYTASIEGVFIPAAWVQAAIGLPLSESGPMIGGQDIAEEGKDKSVLVARRGPVVKNIVSWGQCNTTETAHRIVTECQRLGVSILNFDAVGVGTGPKGTWQSMGETLPFRTNAISGGTPASNLCWPDGRTSAEKFQDVNAELWWIVRQRFERTFEYVNATPEQKADANWMENHRLEDLISIPNHPQLIAELSMPKVEYNDRGKIARESKKKMRSRGIKSPDFAESLVYSFFPDNSDLTISGSDPSESLLNRLPRDVFADQRPVESVMAGIMEMRM